jgi:hypothetical protein
MLVPYINFLLIDEDDYNKIMYDFICLSMKNEI